MADYKIIGPDGETFLISNVPEGLSDSDLRSYIQKQAEAGALPAHSPGKDVVDEMGAGERLLVGMGKAVSDTELGLRQLAAPVQDYLSPRPGASRADELRAEAGDRRTRDAALMDTGAGLAGNVIGNIALALAPGGAAAGAGNALAKVPQAAKIAQAMQAGGRALMAPKGLGTAAGIGAAQGAIQPVESGGERLSNMAVGGGLGAAGSALGKALAPNTSDNLRTLMDEGVRPTIGQIAGGRWRALEDKLTSVPIVGDAIVNARRGAVEELNRAGYNRALAPIEIKSTADIGRGGVADVSQKLGDAYSDVLPRVRMVPDEKYIEDIANVLNRGSRELPDAQNAQLGRIANDQLFGKITGPISGTELKPIQSELNRLSRGMRGDPSYDTRSLGESVSGLNQATRDAVIRSTPEEAEALKKIDQGYSQYSVLRNAAARAGSSGGAFSPEALQAAVRAGDKSVAKGAFARGTANMQDLSDAAVDVLGRGYPDSGTAGRLLLTGGGIGGAAAAGVPGALSAAAVLGGASVPYLPGARQMAALLLAGKRSEEVRKLAPLVRALGISEARAAPSLAEQP